MRPKQAIVSILLFSTAPLASLGCAADDPDPAPPVEDMEAHPPPQQQPQQQPQPQTNLEALRTELLSIPRDQAMAAMAHFRPLCDAAGYPLVGNVASKAPTPVLQPSELCAEVRKHP
jgi:hypothetical protein